MKKIALYFFIGGLIYYLLEVVFRFALGHRGAHPVVALMAGLVCAQVCTLDDHHVRPLLNAVLGGISATILELIVGNIALYRYNERLWHYGDNFSNGIISIKWALIWITLCYFVIRGKSFIRNSKR